jgi:hypothetical protein
MLKFKNIKLDTPTDNAAINPINKGFNPNCLKLENLICKPRATMDSKIRYLDISFNIKTRFNQFSFKVDSIKYKSPRVLMMDSVINPKTNKGKNFFKEPFIFLLLLSLK